MVSQCYPACCMCNIRDGSRGGSGFEGGGLNGGMGRTHNGSYHVEEREAVGVVEV